MKRLSLFLAILSVLPSVVLAQQLARVENVKFKSEYFPFEREILVYTPTWYDENDQTALDVIYVFDSQMRSHFGLVYGLLDEIQYEGEDMLPFIVVGVVSPFVPDMNYNRNNDFLPVPEKFTPSEPYYGSADKLRKHLENEVMPYIDSHYRTSGHTLAVGHSLGASFVLDSFASHNLFDDCIAISPNFTWDENRFANSFLNCDYSNGKPHYIFLSMANESEQTGWPAQWREAWDFVKGKVASEPHPENVRILVNEYPDFSHMRCYVEALTDALPHYAMYRHTTAFTDSVTHPVHIELTGSWLNGDVFITGNQPQLGNWDPQGIKMNKIDDTTYTIDLDLMLPAEFKFTQGSWDSQIGLSNSYNGNQRIYKPSDANKHYSAD